MPSFHEDKSTTAAAADHDNGASSSAPPPPPSKQAQKYQSTFYSTCDTCGGDSCDIQTQSKENKPTKSNMNSQTNVQAAPGAAGGPAEVNDPQHPHVVSTECTEWDADFAYMYVNWPTQPLEGLALYQSLCWGGNKNKPKPVQPTNIICIGFSLH